MGDGVRLGSVRECNLGMDPVGQASVTIPAGKKATGECVGMPTIPCLRY